MAYDQIPTFEYFKILDAFHILTFKKHKEEITYEKLLTIINFKILTIYKYFF